MKSRTVKFIRKAVSLLIVILTITSTCLISACASTSKYTAITDKDLLHTDGYELKTADGRTVRLRGLNLGGWLIQEDWFCPTSSGVNGKSGDWYTMQILEKRFGTAATYALYDSYQDNWLTEVDFKNIADMGYNCVRIPFWYRNFQTDDNGTWRLNKDGEIDLSRLEWAVEMCRKYGIYAILDFHGAVGAQSVKDHTGKSDYYHFFDDTAEGKKCRQLTLELWKVVAKRFAGDPAVAMLDLLNEPMCNDYTGLAKSEPAYVSFYNELYTELRKIDPNHIYTMIAVWHADKLPGASKYGWKNVVYQFHWYDATISKYVNSISALYNTFNGKTRGGVTYDKVPFLLGEFHPTGTDTVPLADVFALFEKNNLNWTAWTYKGLNSWANNSDWWVYGSEQSCTVDPVNDSYETILAKWGSNLRTDSGKFTEAKLFDITKQYTGKANVENAPMNTQDDIKSSYDLPVKALIEFVKKLIEYIRSLFTRVAA